MSEKWFKSANYLIFKAIWSNSHMWIDNDLHESNGIVDWHSDQALWFPDEINVSTVISLIFLSSLGKSALFNSDWLALPELSIS